MLKTLVLVALIYFALKVAVNLWRAAQGDGLPGGRMERQPYSRSNGSHSNGSRSNGSRSTTSSNQRERATRYDPEPDVEDAKWEDV